MLAVLAMVATAESLENDTISTSRVIHSVAYSIGTTTPSICTAATTTSTTPAAITTTTPATAASTVTTSTATTTLVLLLFNCRNHRMLADARCARYMLATQSVSALLAGRCGRDPSSFGKGVWSREDTLPVKPPVRVRNSGR